MLEQLVGGFTFDLTKNYNYHLKNTPHQKILKKIPVTSIIESKKILLIITGSVAAYKSMDLIRCLKKKSYEVTCILTKAASEFITPLLVSSISGTKTYTELFSHDDEFGGVFPSAFEMDKKVWSRDIAEFIFNNRYQDLKSLRADWLYRCSHLNQMVRITEGNEVFEGLFQGLGEHGEAEVCTDGQINHIYNGSLRIIS